MKKSIKFIKRIMALILVLLLSMNTFAAVVSDNDGSAFITTAEFESMKNEFQTQLNNYNTSLDNKIQAAISGYLSGVSLKKKIEAVLPTWYKDVAWRDDLMIYSRRSLYTAASFHTDESVAWRRPNMVQRSVYESGQCVLVSIFGPTHNFWWYYAGHGIRPSAGTGVQPGKNSVANYINWTTTDHNALYGEVLYLKEDDKGNYVNQTGVCGACDRNTWISKLHAPYSQSINIWQFGYDVAVYGDTSSSGFVSNTPPSGYMADYTLKVKRSSDNYEYTVRDRLYGNDLEYACDLVDFPTAMIQTNLDMTTLNSNALRTVDWYSSDTYKNADYSVIPTMMLGTNQNWKATCYREKKTTSPMARYEYIKDNNNATFKTVNVTRGQVRLQQTRLIMSNVSQQYVGPSSTSATLSLPVWTEIELNKIPGKYYWEGKPLTWGQGIPLGEALIGNGKAKVKIKWNKYTGSGGDYSDKKISLKIKKGDFLSSGDYCHGKVNGIAKTFDTSNVLTSGEENDIVIEDLKEGEQLWLQISPAANTTSVYTGAYAKITDFSMTYEFDS